MLGLSALTWFVIIVAGYALLLLILPREYMWIRLLRLWWP